MIREDDVPELSLFDSDPPTAHARGTDPQTSHDAARSIASDAIRVSQANVLAILAEHGPMNDHELVRRYHTLDDPWRPPQSESGIRTRRSELVAAGRIVDTGDRVAMPSGRKSIVWAVAP